MIVCERRKVRWWKRQNEECFPLSGQLSLSQYWVREGKPIISVGLMRIRPYPRLISPSERRCSPAKVFGDINHSRSTAPGQWLRLRRSL